VDLTGSAVEEDTMNPFITQSLMTARVADRRHEAAAARRARQVRRAARLARQQRPAVWPAVPPAQEMIPAPDRALTR
jgi:hypothetical protein